MKKRNFLNQKQTITVTKNKHLNRAVKPKHSSPATKEWSNSIYLFNHENIKGVKNKHSTAYKIIKGYLNLYSKKLDLNLNNYRSRRYRSRTTKLSVNKILTGKLELKHTNDTVIIQLYIYNTIKNSYNNILRKLKTYNKLEKLISRNKYNSYITSSLINKVGLFIHRDILKTKPINYISSDYHRLLAYFTKKYNKLFNLNNKNKKLIAKRTLKLHLLIKLIKKYESITKNKFNTKFASANSNILSKEVATLYNKYILNFINTILKKEYTSIYYKQLISFNKMKFQKHYITSLQDQVKRIYNKNIEFNFVNLKYLHMDSDLISTGLIIKLRKKKTRIYYRLRDVLNMFQIPALNRQRYYDEKYSRNFLLQDPRLIYKSGNDVVDSSIGNYLPAISNTVDNKFNVLNYSDQLSNFLYNVKYKLVKGIRLELSGRLTRRYTAARSLHKLRYKGNIKNTSSSFQGISTINLRGYAESNVQYNFSKAKRRIGSFGVKTWVSGV